MLRLIPPRRACIYRLTNWPWFREPKRRFVLLTKFIKQDTRATLRGITAPKVLYSFRAMIFTSDSQNQAAPGSFIQTSPALYPSGYRQPSAGVEGILPLKPGILPFLYHQSERSAVHTVEIDPIGELITARGTQLDIQAEGRFNDEDWAKLIASASPAYASELEP